MRFFHPHVVILRAVTGLLALFFLFSALPLLAKEIELQGALSQGGVVFGKTEPGAKVLLDGQALRTTEEGQFVFGFGRDFGGEAKLEVRYSDGNVETRTLAIQSRDYEIQRIDGLPASKVTPPEEVWERIQRENAMVAAARAVDRPDPDFLTGWIWPTEGIISGVYGSQRVLNGQPRRPHFGIDVAAPTGTPVLAPADGLVTLAEKDHYFTGGIIILDHGHGLSSSFLHLHEILVETGEKVKRGERIATVGATGRVTGPHLDWRMNWFTERVDPSFLVPPMPQPKKSEGEQ